MPAAADDVRSLDPVSYIQAIGLQPEDSYGFLPVEHQEVCPFFFLYRDRPEYAEARAALPPDRPEFAVGAIKMPAGQQFEMDMDRDLPGGSGGRLGKMIRGATEMAEAFGGGLTPPAPPAAPPDPEKLARLAKLRASGAIDDQEYSRLVSEQLAPAEPPPAPVSPAAQGGTIVAHRLYPGIRERSSTRQLDHFLPRYREALGLQSEDVYGVVPRAIRNRQVDSEAMDKPEWDDFWIIYRDRPEYERPREEWGREMDDKGRWPAAVLSPGVGEAPGGTGHDAKVQVERDRWPRHAGIVRKGGAELGDPLREKIAKWGYEPEDSYGFCPNFPSSSIYFAWRKR